jgi:hypothetical protein
MGMTQYGGVWAIVNHEARRGPDYAQSVTWQTGQPTKHIFTFPGPESIPDLSSRWITKLSAVVNKTPKVQYWFSPKPNQGHHSFQGHKRCLLSSSSPRPSKEASSSSIHCSTVLQRPSPAPGHIFQGYPSSKSLPDISTWALFQAQEPWVRAVSPAGPYAQQAPCGDATWTCGHEK